MGSSMGEVVVLILKILVRLAFVLSGITGFIILLNMGLQLVFVTLNQNALSDVLNLVQVWLPFNLNAIWMWLWTSASLYIVYRLAVAGYAWISRLVGRG